MKYITIRAAFGLLFLGLVSGLFARDTVKDASLGALVGAGAGAVIGNNSGGRDGGKGAMVGAGVGAIAGVLFSHQKAIERQERTGNAPIGGYDSYQQRAGEWTPAYRGRGPVVVNPDLDRMLAEARADFEAADAAAAEAEMRARAVRDSAERARARYNALAQAKENLTAADSYRR